MICKTCKKQLTGRQTCFCSKKCKGSFGNNVHQSYEAQQRRGWERKKKFVLQLGGKCSVCGYDKNLAALDFHHTSGKDFGLDLRSMSNRKESVLVDEVARCVLLCATCHREHHHADHEDWL